MGGVVLGERMEPRVEWKSTNLSALWLTGMRMPPRTQDMTVPKSQGGRDLDPGF